MKILLLSPYDAASHRYWRRSLADVLSAHSVTTVTLPARHFSWRFRGNSLTLAHDARCAGTFDLIIATSMTDLSALRGMLPRLASVPAILYFHENQFAYPDNGDPHHVIERQMTSVYSAVSAQQLVFNSQFNCDTFHHGVTQLLRKMPDGIPTGMGDSLVAKSRIIPVALDTRGFPEPSLVSPTQPAAAVVWNHRWEHDKGLLLLQEIAAGIVARRLPVKVHIIGQPFGGTRGIMEETAGLLAGAGCLGEFGHIKEREPYLKLLASSRIVLSTAAQEFQGLAVQEGIACGCIPVVPDRLVYPAYVPDDLRYTDAAQALDIMATILADEVRHTGDIRLPDRNATNREWSALLAEML